MWALKVLAFSVFSWSVCFGIIDPPPFQCKDGQTIYMPISHFRCNGFPDCEDGSDEGAICNCDSSIEELFRCEHLKNRPDKYPHWPKCIYATQRCDGHPDCADFSDEEYCVCTESQFKCHNDYCLRNYKLVCNGEDDCGDNSDELDCNHNCTVDNKQYRCRDGSGCIPLDQVCNDQKDCPDSSDEGELCKESCHADACKNGQCISHPHGATCVCKQGFKRVLGGPHEDCEDINECENDIICVQSCVNTPGSYHCTCWPGFESREGNKSCVPATTAAYTSYLYFSTKDAIWRRDIITGSEKKLLEVQQDVHAIAADDTFLYWGEGGNHPKVSRMRLTNTSSVERMSILTIGSVEGIAVDWWTGNVYFTDSGRKGIVVLGDTKQKSISLLVGALGKPRGIALHPQSGRMFWTDWGQKPSVGVAQMDGNDFSRLVVSNLKWPNGLSIDYPSERLYWVDSSRLVLESIGLDGEQRREVPIYGTDSVPYSLQVMGSSAYWTEKSKTDLLSSDKFTGKGLRTVNSMEGLLSIYTRDSLIQTKPKDEDNPCKKNPCPYMCLLRHGGRSCVEGITKIVVDEEEEGENRILQMSHKVELLLGYTNELYKVSSIFGTVPEVKNFDKINVGNYTISRFVYSVTSGHIFVADNERKKMLRVAPQHLKEVTELAVDPIGHVSSMTIHFFSENIYWTDSVRRTVEVYSYSKNVQKTLFRLSREHVPMDFEVGYNTGDMLLLTKNRTKLTIIRINKNDKFVYQLKTEVEEDQAVQMIKDGIDNDLKVYLVMGRRIVYWNGLTLDEIEIESNLSPSTKHALFYTARGEFIRTSSDGVLYWGDHRLILRDIAKELKDKKIPKEMPIHGYLPPVEPEVYDDILCFKDNGGCSDICTPSMKGGIIFGGDHCSCGNGRKESEESFDYSENKCVPGSNCDFQCPGPAGECIGHLDVCDGVANCEWGEDERNCTEELRRQHVLQSRGMPAVPPEDYNPMMMFKDIKETLKEFQKREGSGAIIFLLSLILICTVLGFSYALFRKTLRKTFTPRRVNSMAPIAYADCLREETGNI